MPVSTQSHLSGKVNSAQPWAVVNAHIVNNAGSSRPANEGIVRGPDEYDFAAEDFPRMHLTANLDVHGAEIHDRWRGGDVFAWDCAAAEAEATEAGE